MDRKQIKKMLMDVFSVADYDLYKSFCKETAEEWEYSEAQLEKLITIAEKHVKKYAKPIKLVKPVKKAKSAK